MRFAVVSLAFVFVTACPKPPNGGEGEAGEGEGEGGAAGEGEGVAGEGEGEGSISPGQNIVTGAGLNLEDVTNDGVTIAYRDANNALNEVPVAGGSSTPVPTTVLVTDQAEYHGSFLIAYHGFADPTTKKVAITAEVRDGSGTISNLGNNIKISSVKASPDGAHLFHEESAGTITDSNGVAQSIENLFLDGANLLGDVAPNHVEKAKARFAPTSASFMVGAKIVDATATTVDHFVRVFPVGGTTFATIASDASAGLRNGPSTQNQFSPDGNTVFFGAGKNSNVITLAASAADGTGTPVQLRAGADQQTFKISLDGTKVIYLVDTVTSGAIESVGFSGGTPGVIRAGGASKALDLGTLTTNHIVYATSIDATSGNETLAVIGLDGTGDTPIGPEGVDEGSSPDGRFIAARINVNGGVGDLAVFDSTSSAAPKAEGSGIKKVSIASNTEYVSLDSLGTLRLGHFAGGSSQIATGVAHFVLVKDSATSTTSSKVAYSRDADGIWVAGLPQ
jgi:hypothetical protein